MTYIQTPLALVIYKRTDKLSRVIEALSEFEFEQVFIIADGPKDDAEMDSVGRARSISESIRASKITRVYRSNNIGLKRNIYTGVGEAFKTVDRLIVLEDDCVPSADFINLCESLGDLVQSENSVFCGHVSMPRLMRTRLWRSSRFSSWGWMTSKEVWMRFQESSYIEASGRDLLKDTKAIRELPLVARWEVRRLLLNLEQSSSWAVPFGSFCRATGIKSLKPSQTLIQNIGFDSDATHTGGFGSLSNRPSSKRTIGIFRTRPMGQGLSKLMDNLDHLWKYGHLAIEWLIATFRKIWLR